MTSVQDPKTTKFNITVPWLRIGATLLVSIVALLIYNHFQGFEQIPSALAAADGTLVFASFFVIIITFFSKLARWRFLYSTNIKGVPVRALFYSLALGQLVNLLLPARMGDLARVYSLERRARVPMSLSLGVLLLEKVLELTFLSGSFALLLPVIVVPSYARQQGYPLAIGAIGALLILFLIAFQTEMIVRGFKRISRSFLGIIPLRTVRSFGRWFDANLVAGLEGLSGLRNRRVTMWLVAWSLSILVLSILPPFLLFKAFGIGFGFAEAALLNVILSIGSVPPSTPGKIIVFETLVVVTLRQLGYANAATALSFAIVYHLVVVVPQLLFGGLAFASNGLELLPSNMLHDT